MVTPGVSAVGEAEFAARMTDSNLPSAIRTWTEHTVCCWRSRERDLRHGQLWFGETLRLWCEAPSSFHTRCHWLQSDSGEQCQQSDPGPDDQWLRSFIQYCESCPETFMSFLSPHIKYNLFIYLFFVFQHFGDGSSAIKLNDGFNRVEVEVVAEDGTIKKYCVEITRLSAKVAELSNLELEGDIQLYPAFCSKIFEYSCEYRLYMNNNSE